jgi:hypothetical protein
MGIALIREDKMKSHPYEYKMLVEYINPEKAGIYPHFTHADDQKEFTRMLEDVFKHLPESLEEGWEVVSHDIAESRNTLIVTVLLKRPKK